MRRCVLLLALLFVAHLSIAETRDDEATPTYVRSRSVLLETAVRGSGTPALRVWVRTEPRAPWREAIVEHTPGGLRYDAPLDGEFFFRVELQSTQAPPPSDAPPHAQVIVDTTPPTAQIHAADIVFDNAHERVVRLRLSLIEENLGPSGVRLFARRSGRVDWRDGGCIVLVENGRVQWPLRLVTGGNAPDAGPEPRDPNPSASAPSARVEDDESAWDFLLVVTDLAGNRIAHEVLNVASPRARSAGSAPTSAPSGMQPPAIPEENAAPEPSAATTHAATEFHPLALRNREAAHRFAERGQWSLVVARLEDALQHAPGDAELMVELAEALRRQRRYADAKSRLTEALLAAPGHTGAIEQQALIAIEGGRYGEARDLLQKIAGFDPAQPENWLRLGDVNHKLGRLSEAREAWGRASSLSAEDAAMRERAQTRLKAFHP